MFRILTDYEQFIAKSKYSRYLPDKKRREHWEETVLRFMTFIQDHLDERGTSLDKHTAEALYEAILNREVMPSMRLMMTAGPAAKRDNTCAYNCLSGDTKVLTKQHGNIPIKDSIGEVEVLTDNGEWSPAIIKSFGLQKTHTVKLSMNSRIQIINATENHRWYLTDGSVVTTKELKRGNKIKYVSLNTEITNLDDYNKGLLHGIIFGDGASIHSSSRSFGYQLRLCGDSIELFDLIKDQASSICYPPSYHGEPVLFFWDGHAKSTPMKELPGVHESESYMIGFLRGWVASDGSVTPHGQITLCSDKKNLEWLKINGPRFGYNLADKAYSLPAVTNFGVRKTDTSKVNLDRLTFKQEDLVMKSKADKYKPMTINEYTVSSVDLDNYIEEEVYCAVVPGHQNFVIEQGVLTGNCAYLAVDDQKAFDEAMFILLCGTGVGFSVEKQYVDKLPEVPDRLFESDHVISVHDSKEGWAKSLRLLISFLYSGEIPKYDTSKVRKAGSRLKTFGGRASGPEPLIELFDFVIDKFKGAVGRKLSRLECHDIMCKIADVVVVGGVRRSAMISLSDLEDSQIAKCKQGQWWLAQPQRRLANNSAVFEGKPDMETFMTEWHNLYAGKSGERGIFNRKASQLVASRNGRRDANQDFGTNPCSEIILRRNQFCNLTSVIARPEDTSADLLYKVKLAAILGTIQATLTHFPYLRKVWQRNTEAEALLGVSITGIMDCQPLYTAGSEYLLRTLKESAVATNELWANRLGINQAAAVTCVKPEGTVSQLCGTSSGIHPQHSEYYIRTVRADNKDPMTQFMKDQGIPNEPCIHKGDSTTIFSFPVKASEQAIKRKQLGVIEHLDLWLKFQDHYCEHKPSATISIREEEWMKVGAWVYENFDRVTGISFLPYDGGNYDQAPYQEITKEQYEKAVSEMPVHSIDWDSLVEEEDNVEGAQQMSCSAGYCELI